MGRVVLIPLALLFMAFPIVAQPGAATWHVIQHDYTQGCRWEGTIRLYGDSGRLTGVAGMERTAGGGCYPYKGTPAASVRDNSIEIILPTSMGQLRFVGSLEGDYMSGTWESDSVAMHGHWTASVDEPPCFDSPGIATTMQLTASTWDCEILQIDGQILPAEGEVTKIHWDWGDGYDSVSDLPATHVYKQGGRYNAVVTATIDGDQCLTAQQWLNVYIPINRPELNLD